MTRLDNVTTLDIRKIHIPNGRIPQREEVDMVCAIGEIGNTVSLTPQTETSSNLQRESFNAL